MNVHNDVREISASIVQGGGPRPDWNATTELNAPRLRART